MLSILVWLPGIAALVGAIAGGRRTAGACALIGSLGALGISIALIAGFNGNGGSSPTSSTSSGSVRSGSTTSWAWTGSTCSWWR